MLENYETVYFGCTNLVLHIVGALAHADQRVCVN